MLTQVAGGEKLYGMIVDFLPIREKAKGAPVEFVFPTEGVSAISEPVAVLAGTQNPGAAKAFSGVRVDGDGRVLDPSGAPIEGLFAAGEVAGFLGTDAVGVGFEGSITACYWLGLRAGAAAVD